VSIEKGKTLPVKDLEILEEGLVVYLKSFGWVKVFCQQFKNEPRYYVIYHQDLDMPDSAKVCVKGKIKEKRNGEQQECHQERQEG
jgi:hypothetical protein